MEQIELIRLIHKYCKPCSKVSVFSSYGIKGVFEKITGNYITDIEMRAAMISAGYVSIGGHYKVKFIDDPEIPTEYLNPRERMQRNGRV